MICAVCHGMLHRHEGRQWRGIFDLQFNHHADRRSLEDSVNKDCGICRNIWRELLRLEEKDRNSSLRVLRPKQLDLEARSPFISAYLSRPFWRGQEGLYRFDFKSRDAEMVGSFVLQHTSAFLNQCPFLERILTKK